MIKLTSAVQARNLADRLPRLAVERMVQFEGTDGHYDPENHGYIVVLEEGDDIGRDFPLLGEIGVFSDLGEKWLSPFEYVFFVRENGRRIFEAALPLAGDAMLVLIVPEEPWVEDCLLSALNVEGQEADG